MNEKISHNSFAIECFVYRGKDFLGWDCFQKGSVSVGKNKMADIVLEDDNIADLHAVFDVKDNKIAVSDMGINQGIRVNGNPVNNCMLEPLDLVNIGPYSLKVKIQKPLTLNLSPCESDASTPEHLTSDRVNSIVEKEGTEVELVIDRETKRLNDEPSLADRGDRQLTEPNTLGEELHRRDELKECELIETSIQKNKPSPITTDNYEEQDEDEEDEGDTPFFLRHKLLEVHSSGATQTGGAIALEVIKFKDEHIFDVRFLDKKEKYHYVDGKTRFCIAKNRDSQHCYFFFDSRFKGWIRKQNAPNTDLGKFYTRNNIYRKRKGIYRSLVPVTGDVVLDDGNFNYLIRRVVRTRSPKIADPPKPRNPLYKNLMKSAGFHIFIMVVMMLFISLPEMPQQSEPVSRFVQIDTAKLKKTEPLPPRKKQVKKDKPVSIKEKKPKRVQKKRIKKDKPIPVKVNLPKKRPPKKLVAKTKRTKLVKKGNVKNRNIHKEGVLGLLGKSIGFKPNEAMAAVTNLDVVSSPDMTEENFRVGGLVGKLDSPKIEIPSGGIVKTKGTTQVMRSAGAMVAALKEGTTGQKRVKAMVSVDLEKTVNIQGGMSREAVKRVIDQHMDEITFCYENVLMDNPSITGSIVFEWKILFSGRVGEVGIKTSFIRSDRIHSCIKRAIKSWQFPEPRGSEVIVSYPFVFDIVGF